MDVSARTGWPHVTQELRAEGAAEGSRWQGTKCRSQRTMNVRSSAPRRGCKSLAPLPGRERSPIVFRWPRRCAACHRLTSFAPPGRFSVQIEEQPLRAAARERERGLVRDGSAVAGFERLAVDVDFAARDLNPAVAIGLEVVRHGRAVEQRGVETHVLMDGDGAVAAVGGGYEAECVAALVLLKFLLLVARRDALFGGDDPDLEKKHGLIAGRGHLAVRDAGAGAHALPFARFDFRAGAHGVAVGERALEHVRDDLHVAVRVLAESNARLHAIFIDDAQGAESHEARIVVIG